MAGKQIIELSVTQVAKDCQINEDTILNLNGDVLLTFADYVEDITEQDRADVINDLQELPGIVVNQDEETMQIQCKKDWFRSAYARFQNALESAKAMPFGEFVTCKSSQAIWNLEQAYCDTYDYYIWYDYTLKPLDRFLREHSDGELFFIGGIVKYHC